MYLSKQMQVLNYLTSIHPCVGIQVDPDSWIFVGYNLRIFITAFLDFLRRFNMKFINTISKRLKIHNFFTSAPMFMVGLPVFYLL